MGSSHWGPPLEALEDLRPFMADMSVNKYGSITGLPSLKEEWIRQLIKHGYGIDEEEEMTLNRFCEFAELAVTVGAQQTFFSILDTL